MMPSQRGSLFENVKSDCVMKDRSSVTPSTNISYTMTTQSQLNVVEIQGPEELADDAINGLILWETFDSSCAGDKNKRRSRHHIQGIQLKLRFVNDVFALDLGLVR